MKKMSKKNNFIEINQYICYSLYRVGVNMEDIKKKNLIIIVAILFIGLSIIGGTYAFLTMSVNVTNGNYTNVTTHCLNISYSINNTDNTQDMTGTLFPSGTSRNGLTGRVGFRMLDGCTLGVNGTLKMHINSGTSTALTSPASSYCESRSTLEPATEYTTEADCVAAGQRWRGYGDSYCENATTLERMTDYTSSSDCSSHGGTWTTGGSPLKYAVYNTTSTSANPISVGKIQSTDIGNDLVLYNGFSVTGTQTYYYIYIWLDGYLTDSNYAELPFNGYISAEVVQTTSN